MYAHRVRAGNSGRSEGYDRVRVHCGVDRGASPGPPAENLEMCGQARNKVIGFRAVDLRYAKSRQKYDSNFKPAQV